ncbi:MAG: hypothetical protein WC379_08810 [Methanoregula sp.]
MKKISAIPVICSSLIFFYLYLQFLISTPVIIFAGRDLSGTLVPEITHIVPVFIGIVSFTGSLWSIRELRKNSERWYFAVPFVISLAILCISNPLDLLGGGHNLEFFYISQVLAVITSIGFFLSFPEPERKLTRYCAVFSGVVSMYAIGSLFALAPVMLHGSSDALFVVLMIISWVIAMPLVGACFIGTAFLVREKVPPAPQT